MSCNLACIYMFSFQLHRYLLCKRDTGDDFWVILELNSVLLGERKMTSSCVSVQTCRLNIK